MRAFIARAEFMAKASMVLALVLVSPARGEPGDENWESLSQPRSLDSRALAITEFEGDLIVGGNFVAAGDVVLNHIGRWDGAAWHPLGEGFNQSVRCLGVYQGSLIAGGSFTESDGRPMARVARWNGLEWEPLGEGFNADPTVFVEWNGMLVAGGMFQCSGSDDSPCNHRGRNPPPPEFPYVAMWNGTSWQPMGDTQFELGHPTPPRDLIVYQESLYAAGSFDCLDCVDRRYQRRILARWNGAAWVPTGPHIDFTRGRPSATSLALWDSLLVVGGSFTVIDSTPVNRVITYDGETWNHMGAGVASGVRDLEIHGGRLYALGLKSGYRLETEIAEWDGTSWKRLDDTPGPIRDLQSHDGLLYAAGAFAGQVAAWDGISWSEQPADTGELLIPDPVRILASHEGHLILNRKPPRGLPGIVSLGGTCIDPEDRVCVPLFRHMHSNHGAAPTWNAWTVQGVPVTFQGKLIIGSMTWDGEFGNLPEPPSKYTSGTLTVFQDRLIVSGNFGGQSPYTNAIHSWDGEEWTSFGDGLRPTQEYGHFGSRIMAATVHEDRLILGGQFLFDSYPDRQNLAAWDGEAWTPVGHSPNEIVTSVAVYHGDLIAGGFFDRVGDVAASHIARWDGRYWHPLGSGTDGPIFRLVVYNDRLIAGGYFEHAGGQPAGSVAAWDGAGWVRLGSGVDGEVLAMTEHQGDLYVGGEFSRAGGKTALHLARWAEGPRIASFSTLTADRTDNGVLVQVASSSVPFDHQGFHVYREAGNGDRIRLTPGPISDPQFTFTDTSPSLGVSIYWIAGVTSTGAVTWYGSVEVAADPSLSFAVFPAQPNPFRAETTIRFHIAKEGRVKSSVFDVRGRLVIVLLDRHLSPGSHSITWDGRDASRTTVSAGMYFYRVSGPGGTRVQKLLRAAP